MIGLAWKAWHLRGWLLGLGLALSIGLGWLQARALKAELAEAEMRADYLGRAHRENEAAIANLRAERARLDRMAAQRLDGVLARERALNNLIQKATNHDPAMDCPLSPALDNVLDGLSERNGDDGAD